MKDRLLILGSGGFVGALNFLYGEWTPALSALVALILIDWLTALWANWDGGWSSSIGTRGLFKKAALMLIPAVFYLLCQAVGQLALGGLGMEIIVGMIVFNEAISVLENLSKAGVPLPKSLLKRLKKAREVFSDKDEDNLSQTRVG